MWEGKPRLGSDAPFRFPLATLHFRAAMSQSCPRPVSICARVRELFDAGAVSGSPPHEYCSALGTRQKARLGDSNEIDTPVIEASPDLY